MITFVTAVKDSLKVVIKLVLNTNGAVSIYIFAFLKKQPSNLLSKFYALI